MNRSAEAMADRADLRRRVRLRGLVAQPDRSTAHLRAYGLSPEVVFDVGVADTKPQPYRALPEAYFVLIDPGAEVQAGGAVTLQRCQIVILNLSLAERFDRATRPSAIFAMLAAAGLKFRDILRTTGDGAVGPIPRLIDALFTRWPAPTLRDKGA